MEREIVFTEPYDPPQPYYSEGLREKFKVEELQTPADEDNPQAFAKIGYEPNEAEYEARAQARVDAGGLESTVPNGFPPALSGPLVWCGTTLYGETQFIHNLTEADRNEIGQGLSKFKGSGLKGDQVSKDSFPLPNLGKNLENLRDQVYEGRGLAIVRGLEQEKYSATDLIVVYLGISSYIAERRGKQDQRGSMLVDRDTEPQTKDLSKQQVSICALFPWYMQLTSPPKPFHSDTVTDVLGLLTKSCSAQGGKSILASSWTVYNELAATRPDLIHVLAKPDWPFDTFGRDPPYYKRALLHFLDGKVFLNFSRRLLTGHPLRPRTKGIPGLTDAQAEALDAVHFTAYKHQFKTTMQAGDMRFINNMALLHCRTAFQDDNTSKRHLIRVWLNNEKMCWKLPPALQLAWARVFDDEERGRHWDVDPPEGFVRSRDDSCD
ncbi:MAG: hypothetical protein M1822_009815 [Bathelium mastoideum]|nr:MAG: hypothetical protein M1822_009815 [Bathelium mastoideum]